MNEKQLVANETTAKRLIKLIKGKNIAQISISDGHSHISVKQKVGQARMITAPIPAQTEPMTVEQVGAESPKAADTSFIRSENIGTFHMTVKGKPLAKPGGIYEKGAPLALVNAMKIDNELKAPFKCRLKAILFKENGIVEYGTPLFEVEHI